MAGRYGDAESEKFDGVGLQEYLTGNSKSVAGKKSV